MVKDHSDSERGNPLPPHWLLFPICATVTYVCVCFAVQLYTWLHTKIIFLFHSMYLFFSVFFCLSLPYSFSLNSYTNAHFIILCLFTLFPLRVCLSLFFCVLQSNYCISCPLFIHLFSFGLSWRRYPTEYNRTELAVIGHSYNTI